METKDKVLQRRVVIAVAESAAAAALTPAAEGPPAGLENATWAESTGAAALRQLAAYLDANELAMTAVWINEPSGGDELYSVEAEVRPRAESTWERGNAT